MEKHQRKGGEIRQKLFQKCDVLPPIQKRISGFSGFSKLLLEKHEIRMKLNEKYGVDLVSEHALNKNSFGSLVLSLRETEKKN